MSDSIETKELRGVSLRTMYTVIIATAVIVISVVGTYSSLKEQINSIAKDKESETKLNNLRMLQLEQRQTQMEMTLKELSTRIDNVLKK